MPRPLGMPIHKRPVQDYMTPLPHTIGVDQTITSATQRMAQLGVRHLPVLDGGTLVGIVSERDIALVRSFQSLDADRTSVEEAMTADPFAVGPEMPLGAVARAMADRKVGSALVVEKGTVVGIVTTTDILALLADMLSTGTRLVEAGPMPSDVRRRVLDEHKVLRQMIGTTDATASRVLAGDKDAEGDLCGQARELYQTLLRHIELEDELLAPALLESDAFGPVRAESLKKEHVKQRHQLKTALAALETGGVDQLARSLQLLMPYILKDMQHEEKDLLTEGLLKDTPVDADIFTG